MVVCASERKKAPLESPLNPSAPRNVDEKKRTNTHARTPHFLNTRQKIRYSTNKIIKKIIRLKKKEAYVHVFFFSSSASLVEFRSMNKYYRKIPKRHHQLKVGKMLFTLIPDIISFLGLITHKTFDWLWIKTLE